jgi:hypothetical protein
VIQKTIGASRHHRFPWAFGVMLRLIIFQPAQERAIGFAKENAEASFVLASELANAKDMQEVLTLQSRYAQTQIQSYTRQVQELGRLMSEAMRDMQPKG